MWCGHKNLVQIDFAPLHPFMPCLQTIPVSGGGATQFPGCKGTSLNTSLDKKDIKGTKGAEDKKGVKGKKAPFTPFAPPSLFTLCAQEAT